jgi:hypothetical protein
MTAKPITLTIGTARSGTRLLSRLFAEVPDMAADHECEGESFCTLRRANIANPSIGREFVQRFVNDYVNNLPGKYYSNTAQSVSNGWVEHFLDIGIKPTFVILRRDPRLVAKSLWELEWIPGRDYGPYAEHRIWFPSPEEPGTLPFADWKTAAPYQLCYWYVCEMERRKQYYEQLFNQLQLKTWDLTIEKMLDVKEFNNMLDHFNLPNVQSLPQKKVNTLRSWRKRDWFPPDDTHWYKLELDVLDRIPVQFKNNLLERGWAQPP